MTNYHADKHTEQGGTVVSGMNGTEVTTRLGVRIHGNRVNDEGMRLMRPFGEVNWWHGKNSQTAIFNNDLVRDNLPSDRIEAKVGLQGNVTRNTSVYGAVGMEAGSRDDTAGKAQVGVKYSW